MSAFTSAAGLRAAKVSLGASGMWWCPTSWVLFLDLLFFSSKEHHNERLTTHNYYNYTEFLFVFVLSTEA